MASPYPYAHLYDELPDEMAEIDRFWRFAEQQRDPTPVKPVKVKRLPSRTSEKAFMAQVIELARMLGWRTYHTFDSRHSTAGFPDLCMVKPATRRACARILFAELKTARGKVSAAQTTWLELLAAVPSVEVELWRPADLQKIAEVLS